LTVVPILHRLLVKPDPVETKTQAGIILAINEKREQAGAEMGTVIAVGDTAFKDFKADVVPNIGDRIYFAKYAGKEITLDGDRYLLLNDEDTLGLIKE